jgi:copper(I)-binding protein
VSRYMRTRPAAAAVVIGAMTAAVALAGCGAGQITQTDTQVASVNGANAGAGAISARDATIEFSDVAKGATVYPRGGSAPLQMSIVNAGTEGDRLISATSPVAASVQIIGPAEIPAGHVVLIEGAPAGPAVPAAPAAGAPGVPAAPGTPAGTAAPGAPGSAAPTTAAGPTPTGTALPAPTTVPGRPVATPPAQPATTAPGSAREASIVLTGLREDIQAGKTYPVTFTFERGGVIQFGVPVENPTGPRDAPAE